MAQAGTIVKRNGLQDPHAATTPHIRDGKRVWPRRGPSCRQCPPRAGQFGRFQCKAAIQSAHIHRPITGYLNLTALQTLYDLLVAQSDSIGARLGWAVVMAEYPDEAAAALTAALALSDDKAVKGFIAQQLESLQKNV